MILEKAGQRDRRHPETDYLAIKHTILLVEDDRVIVRLTEQILLQADYHVLVATNGNDGLLLAEQRLPSLILLDIMMPEMDGFEVCKKLKQNPKTQDIPIIFMTGLDDIDSVVRGLELGAVDYIAKPIERRESLARINNHLTMRALRLGLEKEIVEREKLIANLKAFSHMVAHDLKNPIANLIGFAEILRTDLAKLSDEQIQSTIEYLVRSGHKAIDIVENLLLLASVGVKSIVTAPIEMNAVITEALSQLEYQIQDYDAQITVADDLPQGVGYPPWVEEVWVNYISNALKYGGTPPVIEIGGKLAENGRFAFYYVKDNGRGVTPEQTKEIFKPFTRFHLTKEKSHGLGLAIVQRIIEKLGGDVWVDSQLDQGSQFYFALPLETGHL